jgi:hypothetical protein
MRVDFDADNGSAIAIVPDRQLSLAIGKEGQNARLAAKLTGWKLDIKSDVEASTAEPDKVEAAGTTAVAEAPPEPETPAAVAEQADATAAEAPSEEPTEVEEEVVAAEVVEEAAQAEAQVEEPTPEDGAVEEAEPGEAEEVAPDVFLPEEIEEPAEEPVPVGEESSAIQDLPEEIWNIRKAPTSEPGVIRFAEDIDELTRRVGSRRGRRGASRTGPSTASTAPTGRRTKAGRKRRAGSPSR